MSAVLVEINHPSALKKYIQTAICNNEIDGLTLKKRFIEEVETYLKHYPQTQHVDIYLCDLNGHLRGKRIDVSCLKNLSKGCYFPLSIYAMSLDGKVIEETGLGKYIGEPDHLCEPVLGTLKPHALEPETTAQLLLSMKDDHQQDCVFEPRNMLKKILSQLHDKSYFPCIAAEVEFYLQPLSEADEVEESVSQCFDINTSDHYQNILNEIEAVAKRQRIQIIGIVSESSSGQYEINLQHTTDLLSLCDQIMLLKRSIKQIANKHGLRANFLAKPDMHKAGSGMHFHMSLLDQHQQNLFSSAQENISDNLLKAVSGLLLLMPDSMAILAPNLNSFRRFKFGNHVPLEANWGLNNRNVAIRIPCSDQENQRLEYRVAGADCNPYLAVAIILIGTLHGLTQGLDIPKQAHQLKLKSEHVFLPTEQMQALQLFQANSVLIEYLGKDFATLWCTLKQAEYQSVYSQITAIEKSWDI
ncbi:glutamine synthetase family protein [Acinetobacter sp. NIPH1876]|uniref:glutamine synthetase family protein n=1 Tax=Acinetobacter TaxID=469 RepID=UPI001F4A53C4|nr:MULTISPECIES: glutamine synthetase family protein [Acinetobacter]MCH7295855.1 glutamine synthetase family protein [Acinetobacter higginsii]MCH7339435.1 glutamine synthetase family protein [Acinetobacter higginsii]MCJ0827772.1 glutamine synthetase family protein [Acinetobacter sp. NIPH1876]